jgi:hypothetical protein
VAALSVATFWRARSAGVLDREQARVCFVVLGALACWVAASSALAIRGTYIDPWVLQFLPLLVGFLVPTTFVAVCLLRLRTFRMACRRVIAWLPIRWLVGVQAIRITALGTILKYLDGELPAHFILPVGVPDFLIGLTALPLAIWVAPKASRWSGSLAVWNVLGCLIFAYAGLALHFSVPTPIQLFTSGPTTESIFRFPLALVPTVLVPFFIAVHAATLWRLTMRDA